MLHYDSFQEKILQLTFLATLLSGEASTRQSFTCTGLALSLWAVLSVIILSFWPAHFSMTSFVWAVNVMCFIGGALALYGASITSHVITTSFHHAFTKFILRFCNFLILFFGLVLIILVSSGEISWITYFYNGVHA